MKNVSIERIVQLYFLWLSGLELKRKPEQRQMRILNSALFLHEDCVAEHHSHSFLFDGGEVLKIQTNHHRRRHNKDWPDGLVVLGLDSPGSCYTRLR